MAHGGQLARVVPLFEQGTGTIDHGLMRDDKQIATALKAGGKARTTGAKRSKRYDQAKDVSHGQTLSVGQTPAQARCAALKSR